MNRRALLFGLALFACRPQAPTTRADADLTYVELARGVDGETPAPWIVALHGLGDRPEDFAPLFARFEGPARILVPAGLHPAGGGGYSWFPGRVQDGDTEALARAVESAADRIARSIEARARDPRLVGRPVITGFSQGGMLAYTLALRHPELVKAALPIGGFLPRATRPLAAARRPFPPIHAFHGADDPIIPFHAASDSVEALRAHGLSITLARYDGLGHQISPKLRDDLYYALSRALK